MKTNGFRGQRVDNKEWVYGYYVKIDDKHYITDGKDYAIEVCGGKLLPTFIEVIPETVGQYIGEKDIKGVKIYFQDLVKAWIYGDEEPQVLEVLYEGCGFIINYEDSESDCVLVGNFVGQLEVIDNIHDNPEL